MAIGARRFGNVVAGNGASSLAVPYPSAPQSGELLLIFCYSRQNIASAFTQPSGWGSLVPLTQTANGSYAIYSKLAAGGESGTQAVAASTSGNSQLARMMAVPGAKNAILGTAFKTTGTFNTGLTNLGQQAGISVGDLCLVFDGKGDGGNGTTNDFSGYTVGGPGPLTMSSVANGTTGGSDAAIGIAHGVAAQTDFSTMIVGRTSTLGFAGITCVIAIDEAPAEARTGTGQACSAKPTAGTATGSKSASGTASACTANATVGQGTGSDTQATPATGCVVLPDVDYVTVAQPGQEVIWTATGSGSTLDGAATPQSFYQFKFFRQDNGGAWNVVQDWSYDSTYSWLTPAAAGTYIFAVWARTTTADPDVYGGEYVFVVYPYTQPTGGSLWSSDPGPVDQSTQITVNASGSGALTYADGSAAPSGAYSYLFHVFRPNGGGWEQIGDWQAGASIQYTLSELGTYTFAVHVRTDTIDARTYYDISTITVESQLPSEDRTGTGVTVEADATVSSGVGTRSVSSTGQAVAAEPTIAGATGTRSVSSTGQVVAAEPTVAVTGTRSVSSTGQAVAAEPTIAGATGTRSVSSTGQAVAAEPTIAGATGTRSVSSTGQVVAAEPTVAVTGTRTVSGTGQVVAAEATMGLGSGTAVATESRSGTGQVVSAEPTAASATGTRAVSRAGQAISAEPTAANATGARAVAGTGLPLAAEATMGLGAGSAAEAGSGAGLAMSAKATIGGGVGTRAVSSTGQAVSAEATVSIASGTASIARSGAGLVVSAEPTSSTTGTRAVSSTGQSVTARPTAGAATGTRAISRAAVTLTAKANTGTPSGTAARSGTANVVSAEPSTSLGAGQRFDADQHRTGAGNAVVATGFVGTSVGGARSVEGTASAVGAVALTSSQGYSTRENTAADVVAVAALLIAYGTRKVYDPIPLDTGPIVYGVDGGPALMPEYEAGAPSAMPSLDTGPIHVGFTGDD